MDWIERTYGGLLLVGAGVCLVGLINGFKADAGAIVSWAEVASGQMVAAGIAVIFLAALALYARRTTTRRGR